MADREPNPLVEQIRRGGVPLEVRMMAAEGALPLKPEDVLDLLELMHRDPLPEVASLASKTFAEMSVEVLLPLVKSRDALVAVLAGTLDARTESALLEACLQNVSTPDEAIAHRSPELPEALAELVVINQTRLLRYPPLLGSLESNPKLSRDQRRRLSEFRETFSIGAEPEPEPEPLAPKPEAAPEIPTPAAPSPEPAPTEPISPEPIKVENAAGEAPVLDENTVQIDPEEALATLTDDEKKDEKVVSELQRLFSLTTGKKVKAALTGDSQARNFLIRDPNRLVALAVLGSPKITEAEIEHFAAMKNVSMDVLRKIGTNKDWTKKYTVVSSLVKNPRTPLGIAMGFISRMQPRDMKAISVDKNVPEAIRRAAQRFVKASTQAGTKE